MIHVPSIRILEPRDLPVVKRMWLELMTSGSNADSRFNLTPDPLGAIGGYAEDMWPKREPFPHGWVVECNDELVAFVLGLPRHSIPVLTKPNTAQITDLWVVPHRRREGLGRLLVERFCQSCKESGYPSIEVSTLTADTRAVDFWKELGFGDWMVQLSLRD
jgi:GNAT superfamily N-acetyltransferase